MQKTKWSSSVFFVRQDFTFTKYEKQHTFGVHAIWDKTKKTKIVSNFEDKIWVPARVCNERGILHKNLF